MKVLKKNNQYELCFLVLKKKIAVVHTLNSRRPFTNLLKETAFLDKDIVKIK